MGSADTRNDSLAEATSWGWTSASYPNTYRNLMIDFEFVDDLWNVPAVQAQLRARWAELRQSEFSNGAISQLFDQLRDEIAESYPRELTVWNGNGYGPRQGNGLFGEVDFTKQWVQTRLNWMDGELISGADPNLSDPGTINIGENQPLSRQLQVSGGSAYAWSHTDLPAGLTLDDDGLLSGTVAIGDTQTLDVTVTVTNQEGGQDSETFTIDIAPSFSGPADIVLNEYNAVVPGGLLDLNGSDSTLGRVAGNGGDWFEVVTISDNLDLRGWRFDLFTNDLGGVRQIAALVLGDDPELSDIRAGTIITVAESIPEDLSYDPQAGDWTINLQANTAQQGAWWANQTDFDTNNTKWRLVVRDSSLSIRGPVAGETEPWDDANFGVSGGEVMHLGVNPTANPNLIVDYRDSVESTFGAPNPTTGGGVQDFSALRPELLARGEVNCSDSVDIVDALFIAQFAAQNRSVVDSCPLPDPAADINVSVGDFNDDGNVNIVDALLISQCAALIDNGFCD